jgi:hypothetical protein
MTPVGPLPRLMRSDASIGRVGMKA